MNSKIGLGHPKDRGIIRIRSQVDDRFIPTFMSSYPRKGAECLKVQASRCTEGGVRCGSRWKRICSLFVIFLEIRSRFSVVKEFARIIRR